MWLIIFLPWNLSSLCFWDTIAYFQFLLLIPFCCPNFWNTSLCPRAPCLDLFSIYMYSLVNSPVYALAGIIIYFKLKMLFLVWFSFLPPDLYTQLPSQHFQLDILSKLNPSPPFFLSLPLPMIVPFLVFLVLNVSCIFHFLWLKPHTHSWRLLSFSYSISNSK